MVSRYLKRTRRNRLPQTLQDETLTQLRQQTDALLKQLTEQFTRDLRAIQRQASQGFSDTQGSDGGGLSLGSSFSSFFNAGANYLFSRPRIKTGRATETSRSVDANTQFRLSQSQALAEASARLGVGDKNR